MAGVGFLHQVLRSAELGSEDEEDQEEGRADAGGQETEDGVQLGAVGEAAHGVPSQPVSHRGTEETPLSGAWTQRKPDQDLVPKQASEAEEGDGGQGGPGQDVGRPGAVQPPDGRGGR